MGDIKLAALIGIIVGYPLVIVAIFLAVMSGGFIGVILLLLKLKKSKQIIPFGPFLSMATIVTLVYGQNIYDWYLALF